MFREDTVRYQFNFSEIANGETLFQNNPAYYAVRLNTKSYDVVYTFLSNFI